MKKTLVTLLLFSLALAGCVIEPGGGYDHRGWDDHGHGWHHDDGR
jgi:hypothetical protein